MRGSWLLALLCAEGVALAEPDGVPGEARLATAAEVKAACAARAAGPGSGSEDTPAVYRVTLPSTAFQFAEYDAARMRLPVDVARGFRPPRAGWELVMHDLRGAAHPASPLDVAIPVAPEEARAVARAHDSGSLELTLWFQLAGGADTPACAAVHRTTEDGVRVAVEPVAFAVTKGRERIAGGELPSFAALRDADRPVVEPHVTVNPPVLTGARGKAPDKVARAAEKLGPALLDCYRRGLAADPALRGSLAVEIEVAADGHVTTARAELDGLGAPDVVTCALGEARAAKFPGKVQRFSVPIVFGD